MENSQNILPLFPLSIFAFPGEEFTLHVFEDKFKELVNDVTKTDHNFLIPFILNGKQQNYGTLVTILNVEKKNETGEMDIRVKSLQLFQNLSIAISDKLYAQGSYRILDSMVGKPSEKLLTLYMQYLTLRKQEGLKSTNFANLDLFKIASGIHAPSYQKFNFIEGESALSLERNLVNYLKLQIRIESMTKDMGPKFVLN